MWGAISPIEQEAQMSTPLLHDPFCDNLTPARHVTGVLAPGPLFGKEHGDNVDELGRDLGHPCPCVQPRAR